MRVGYCEVLFTDQYTIWVVLKSCWADGLQVLLLIVFVCTISNSEPSLIAHSFLLLLPFFLPPPSLLPSSSLPPPLPSLTFPLCPFPLTRQISSGALLDGPVNGTCLPLISLPLDPIPSYSPPLTGRSLLGPYLTTLSMASTCCSPLERSSPLTACAPATAVSVKGQHLISFSSGT